MSKLLNRNFLVIFLSRMRWLHVENFAPVSRTLLCYQPKLQPNLRLRTLSSETTSPSGQTCRPPLPVTQCCMSGCANCIWLTYAEEVIKFYIDKGANVPKNDLIREIEENIDDEMIKAFVLLEVRMKFPAQ